MSSLQFVTLPPRFNPLEKPSPHPLPNPNAIFHSVKQRELSLTSPIRNQSKSGYGCARTRMSGRGGALSACACSTVPFKGRVGRQRRDGNVSLLSFDVNPSGGDDGVGNSDDASQVLSAMLPFVVAATAVAALAQPSTFTWVSKDLYAPALGGIMLSIGIKLSIDDFALAFKRPLPLSIGFMTQYVLKPALGGAQLSCYASFLSKGDVALSVLLTSSTTLASVLVTPLLTGLLIGSVVPVDAIAMSKSILQVVLVPVSLGLLLNTYAKPVAAVIQPLMPFVAMICTSMCIGSPLAINQRQILSAEGLRLLFPVLLFHVVAFTSGYWISKTPSLRQKEQVSRTISLCTGMQSSTLAGLLATQFLGSTQAVPAACSVVVMAIMGLCLSSFWGSGFCIRELPSLIIPGKSGSTERGKGSGKGEVESMKSAKEIKNESEFVAPLRPGKAEMEFGTGKTIGKDVSCVEIFQGKDTVLKSLMRVFGGGNEALREHVMFKPPMPSVVVLQISDGSCVESLQVLVESIHYSAVTSYPYRDVHLASGILRKPLLQGKYAIELTVEKILHVVQLMRNHILVKETVASGQNGFLSVDAPIITPLMVKDTVKGFRITTLYEKSPEVESAAAVTEDSSLDAVKAAIKEKSRNMLLRCGMVEAEMAFSDLEDDYLTFLCKTILEKASEDMAFVTKRIDKTIIDRLQAMASASIEKLTYTQAVELLNKVADKKQQTQIKWGTALTDEQMSCLVDEIFKRPVVVFIF
ncbi:unnamed protein product [Rhodiola kirilowii]